MLNITIRGVKQTPSWTTLQLVLEQVTKSSGLLTRISRVDGGVNYRAPGAYAVTFTPEKGDDIAVNLLVTEKE